MGENGRKKLMVMMMMLLVTLFLILKHVEDNPLPLSAPNMAPSLHSFPLRARLLSFSVIDGGEHRKKKDGGKHSKKKSSIEGLLKKN
jgi:hypothetical protein